MKENIELLNFIYQKAKMGLIGIENIKPNIKNEKILKIVKAQEKNYFLICNTSTDYLNSMKEERKDISNIAKVMNLIDVRISTMNDNSSSNIAKTIIISNNQNVIDIQEKINKYQGKSKRIINLAKRLLQIEKRNIENLEKYL